MGSVNKYYSLYFILFLLIFVVFIMCLPSYPDRPKEDTKGYKLGSGSSLQDSKNRSEARSEASTVTIPTEYIRRVNSNDEFIHVNQRNLPYKSPALEVRSALKSDRSETSSNSGEKINRHVSFDSGLDIENSYHFQDKGRKFGSTSEKITCKVFEEFLGREVLTNIRPDFLKNPKTKRNLELDMYDPITKIAVEYNGAQHYQNIPAFGNNFTEQQERDILKRKLCEDNGIILIVVPYTIDSGIPDNKGGYKYISRTMQEKEKRISNFLLPLLEEALCY
jgi:hypothetical protein